MCRAAISFGAKHPPAIPPERAEARRLISTASASAPFTRLFNVRGTKPCTASQKSTSCAFRFFRPTRSQTSLTSSGIGLFHRGNPGLVNRTGNFLGRRLAAIITDAHDAVLHVARGQVHDAAGHRKLLLPFSLR